MTDAWTKVTSKSRRRAPPPSSSPQSHTSPDTTPSPRTTGPFLSIDEIRTQHEALQSTHWTSSSTHAALIALLDTHFATHPVPIHDAICLGAGTFDPADGSWQAKRSTHLQVLAFETIVSHLETLLDTKIRRFTQEPILTSNDEGFLTQHLSHTVLPSPQAFAAVTPTTLLFGIHLYRPIYAAALETCLPGIFIGTGADVWDTVSMEKKDDVSRLQQIHDTYDNVAFPEEKNGTSFLNTTIYFKRPQMKTETVGDVNEEKEKEADTSVGEGDKTKDNETLDTTKKTNDVQEKDTTNIKDTLDDGDDSTNKNLSSKDSFKAPTTEDQKN